MTANKILIVEDEKKIADTLRFGLEENGYRAEVAYDGDDAFRLFSEQAFGLLLLDVNIPGINGLELCRQVRTKNTAVPIIILTCMNTLTDKVDGYEAGADDYVVKPFEFRELLLKIKAIQKRNMNAQLPESDFLTAGGLMMNLASKEVTRNGEKINLTAKEFQLLEYLLRNKNKVMSRADIAVHVWGIDFDTNTNVIDVYVNYLRNKIDRKFVPRLIHTHIGMGYILKANGN